MKELNTKHGGSNLKHNLKSVTTMFVPTLNKMDNVVEQYNHYYYLYTYFDRFIPYMHALFAHMYKRLTLINCYTNCEYNFTKTIN